MKKKIQKPFDIEDAKNGAKVETRDGMPVRIICYDKVDGIYPILALVNNGGYETCNGYTPDGKLFCSAPGEHDLVIIEEVEATKFNVGDWIFKSERSLLLLITAVNSGFYRIQDTRGYTAEINQRDIDKSYHLWTLKDAKSGDILCYKDNRPFMFKELRDGYPVAYFGIDYEDSILIGNGLIWTKDSVRPATSNEKDMLFKKMEEEGYEWDAETFTLTKKRWRDNEYKTISGYYTHTDSHIIYSEGHSNTKENYNLFATKKQVKSALAMARISQIMANDERFGGTITDEEWCDNNWLHVIIRADNDLEIALRHSYVFLAFHTKEQAELFLKENEDLVRDYYMMY